MIQVQSKRNVIRCFIFFCGILLSIFLIDRLTGYKDSGLDFAATTQSVAECGNEIIDAGEECDGHERENGVYCNEDCTLMLLE